MILQDIFLIVKAVTLVVTAIGIVTIIAVIFSLGIYFMGIGVNAY